MIGVSAPNVFTKEIIASMADKAIVFALANPVPETSYADAIEAGAAVAGTGRSDSPNQVNNVTVFPGVFRGAIDVRAKAITEEMKVAAVYAISELIDEKDLRADYVVPDAFDRVLRRQLRPRWPVLLWKQALPALKSIQKKCVPTL